MIQIEKVILHDKKRLKHWATVILYFKGFYSTGIVETNLKTLESKINWVRLSPAFTPEIEEEMKIKGVKGGQSILNELTPADQEVIINTVKESEVLTIYTLAAK